VIGKHLLPGGMAGLSVRKHGGPERFLEWGPEIVGTIMVFFRYAAGLLIGTQSQLERK
jgi:hypothetical protein